MGIKCFIKCDIHIKDYIAVCLHIIMFFIPLLLIQAFCYLTLGLCLFSTTRIPYLWLLQNVLSSPEIIFEICQFSFQDLFTTPPVYSSNCYFVLFLLLIPFFKLLGAPQAPYACHLCAFACTQNLFSLLTSFCLYRVNPICLSISISNMIFYL